MISNEDKAGRFFIGLAQLMYDNDIAELRVDDNGYRVLLSDPETNYAFDDFEVEELPWKGVTND